MLFSVCHRFSSIALLPTNPTGSRTDNDMSGIAKSRVPVDQLAQTLPIRASTSCRTNLFLLYRCIALSNTPGRGRKAAIGPQLTIGKRDVRTAPSPSDMHAAWASYPRNNITWDFIENRLLPGSSLPTNNFTGFT